MVVVNMQSKIYMYIHEICMKNVGQQKHKCNNKIICYIHTFVYKKKDIVVKTLIGIGIVIVKMTIIIAIIIRNSTSNRNSNSKYE